MKKEVWWLQSLMKVWDDMRAPAAVAIGCLAFELSKLRFRGHNLFDGFLKGANKMHNR